MVAREIFRDIYGSARHRPRVARSRWFLLGPADVKGGASALPRQILNPLPILSGKLKFRGSHILFEMGERRCSGDWQHNRRFLQQPRERELHGADVMAFRFGFERIATLGQRTSPAPPNRSPWHEAHL